MTSEGVRLWKPLPNLTPGAVLLMRVQGIGAHVGFQTSYSRFLQAMEGLGVRETRIGTFQNLIIGAYEYVGDGD